MLELALNYDKKPLSINAIAANEDISAKFLGQIIIPLKGAGLIQSTRGASGGYMLTRPPGEISLFDVFQVLEGDWALTECVPQPATCDRTTGCIARNVWCGLSAVVENKLKSITFASLVEDSERLNASMSPSYQI